MLRFFTRNKPDPALRRLYDDAVAQARQPVFYQTFGVPDTLDGRFDMVVFHVWPLIDALRHQDGRISDEGQTLFDIFVEDMEQNLRAIGVGDTSFPKKMKAIGRAFYGRFDAYRRAAAEGEEALARAAARNILGDESLAGSATARGLAAYGMAMRAGAAAAVAADRAAFPAPDAFAPAEAAR